PEALADAGRSSDLIRLAQSFAVESSTQCCDRLVVADETAAIHVAVAGAMLQWDPPLPSRIERGGTCVGRKLARACAWPRACAWHCDRAIARQPLRPFFVAGVERTFDEQATKSGTVDEQIARDAPAVCKRDGIDEAAGFAQAHIRDPRIDVLDASLQRVGLEISRVQTGIELKCVRVVRERRGRFLR